MIPYPPAWLWTVALGLGAIDLALFGVYVALRAVGSAWTLIERLT